MRTPDPVEPTKLLFHVDRLGPRTRIGICQLPLTAVLAVVVITSVSAHPAFLDSNFVVFGLAGHLLLALAAWGLPWDRFPNGAPLIIPVCDLVVIGLLNAGAPDNMRSIAALAVFPVIWLSVSGMFPWAGSIVSFVGPLLIVALNTPLLSEGAEDQLSKLFPVPLMLLTVSLAIRSVAGNVARQQRLLKKQDKKLRELLNSSTERERLLSTILDAVDVGILAVDANGDTILSNEWLMPLVGGSTPAAKEDLVLLGQDKETILPPDKHPIHRAINGEEFGDYVVWAGKDNDQRALSTAARSMHAPDGRFSGAVMSFSDVTSLYEAIAAKDELIANVSHDLRSPLTSILGNLDLVLDQMRTDTETTLGSVAPNLETTHHSAERLLEMVSNLLLSASAATSIHPRKTDLAGLVQSCIGAVQLQAQAAQIRIITDLPSPLWAHVDPARIAQVVDNVISNAIKYSPDGGEIRITASSNGHEANLEVVDSGLGMSPLDASRVFDKFFRSNEVRDAAIPGTGLGLSIAKSIVDKHGGRIHCSSTLGEGTKVNVRLSVDPSPA